MNELLKRFLDYLGSIDGHKARQLMKRLNEFSAAASVWLVSTGRGTWEPWLTGAVYVISAALEFIASQRAQKDRARDVSAPEADVEVGDEDEDPEEFSKPDYDRIYKAEPVPVEPRGLIAIPGAQRMSPVIVERGFPPEDEIDSTAAKLAGDPVSTVHWTDPHDGPRRKDFTGENHRYEAVMFRKSLPFETNPRIA